ncbi:leucyl aminopeptidase [Paenibacillus sp. HB172176]|uniref:leucyl aminopeptidase n=1 Tax=Paenibacillus sp. HB172176 TaxID=2493690 RepID=UPI001439BC67|nr:leucyl aminopeptidase [Paenibacillus sp. HB172176]
MTSFTYGKWKKDQGYEAMVILVGEAELKEGKAYEQFAEQPEIRDRLRSECEKGVFVGKEEQIYVLPTLGRYAAAYLVFAGYEPGAGAAGLRIAASAAAKALKSIKARQAVVVLREDLLGADFIETGASASAQALVEGMRLALYDRKPLKREESVRFELDDVLFVSDEERENGALGDEEAWKEGIRHGSLLADSVCYARDLVHMPGNELTPERLASYAEELAAELELDIEVIDEFTAAEQGMGGLLGVGQGSAHPPRMIVIHYNGDPDSSEVLGLIGKGITFDTGGISLKRAAGMEEMISDMSGAAAVLGAVKAIAGLKAKRNIVAVIPAAENMPSDRALKPGDVIRTMSGYTVEVVNTDAEGRLVLADAVTAAIRRGATRLVDVATLTGAVVSALGHEASGAIGNDDAFMKEMLEASNRTGERIWELPSYPEYKKLIRSDAADLKNSGGRYAGAITAGLFIGHFTEGLPWVHLDIAATAWLHSGRKWEPKGATGVMVRTLAELSLR